MFDVITEIEDVAGKYIPLGTALGIKLGELQIIEKKYKGNQTNGLRGVILLWLRQNYDSHTHCKPTWKMLAKAIANLCGGTRSAVVRELIKKHLLPCDSGNQSFFGSKPKFVSDITGSLGFLCTFPTNPSV